MRLLAGLLVVGWVALHLSGYGVFISRRTPQSGVGAICVYIHSTGVHEVLLDYGSIPCPKTVKL